MEPITVRMLGEFSLEARGNRISDAENRARKVWSILAYLLCNRDRSIPQKTLIDLFWSDESANPENALRITLHRLRGTLDQLWPGAGRELILYREGGYGWNREADVCLDSERFEELSGRECRSEDARLEACLEALALYQGDFLPRQNSELHFIPIASHYQNCFVQLCLEAGALLLARQRWEEAEQICRRAAAREPYREDIHQLLIQVLGAKGDQKGASKVYDALSKRLFDDFGIRPSSETREAYRSAAHSTEDRTLPMDEVLEHLQEPPASGALVCDYDYFKILCFAESRSMERSGNATHVALFSAQSAAGGPLPKRSLTRVMEQLEITLRRNLRRGDTIARCSASQYIIMLPRANYENSCMVCRRIMAAFQKNHARSAAKISYMVQPLSPGVRLPQQES